MNKKLYTDYPFTFLGDKAGKEAPIREITALAYDDDKYVKILVEGKITDIKLGYIYTNMANFDDAKFATVRDLQV